MSEQKWHIVRKKGSKPVPTRQKAKAPAENNHTSPPMPPTLATERRSKPVAKNQQSFEKYLKQMDVPALCSRIMNAQSEFKDTPEVLLREVTVILSSEFSTVQPESDFRFDFAPNLLHEDLLQCCLETLSLCPQDALLHCFRYCMEILLTEVKHHQPSYGTRILLGLLSNHCEALYKESAEQVAQLLSSCVNRIPEALSLLSAALPRSPSSSAAVYTWYVVCFPLLQSEGNVPRDVLQFVEQYSLDFVRGITTRQASELASHVTPEKLLKAILSKHSSAKRSDVQAKKLSEQMTEILAPCYSEQEAMMCFHLALYCDQPSNECVQKLLILMLELFPSCFQLWAQEFMSCQSMSCALLNYMKQHLGQINTAEFPRAYLVQFLSQCCTFSKGEAPKLCEELLANIEDPRGSQAHDTSSPYLYPVIVVLVVCYMVVLGLLLYRLALRGPGEFAWLLPPLKFDKNPPHLLLLQLLSLAVRPLAQII